MATVSSVITSIKSFLTSKYLALTGGKMSGGIEREGTTIMWREILDANKKSSCGLYQSTYNGYMPMLNMMTTDGRVGIGTYQNYLRMTYFLNTNTTNSPDNYLHLDSSSATVNGKPIVCVTKWTSGTSWYRVYSDGWIEQGGYFNCSTNGKTVTFHKAFSNTNYYLDGNASQTTAGARFTSFYNRTTTNAACYTGDDSSFNAGYVYWYASGY